MAKGHWTTCYNFKFYNCDEMRGHDAIIKTLKKINYTMLQSIFFFFWFLFYVYVLGGIMFNVLFFGKKIRHDSS